MSEDTKAREHQAIALAIKSAKRKMFELSRNGVDLKKATDVFLADVRKQFSRIIFVGPDVVMEENESARLESLLTEIGHRPNPPAYAHVPSPSRDRNGVCERIAEILRNDTAPPELRNAVVRYVTDDTTHEADAATNIDATENTDDETGIDRINEIEEWARGAVQEGDQEQQLNPLRVLNEIVENPRDAENIAMTARNAAFQVSESLIDEAIDLVVKNAIDHPGSETNHAD